MATGNANQSLAVRLSGDTMTGALILNADPTNALGAVTKQYADAIAAGMTIEPSCYAGTTADLNATYSNGASGVGATLVNAGSLAAFSVDGTSPSSGARILVKNQTNTFENGIYTVTTVGSGAVAWVLTRATNYDQAAEIQPGDFVIAENGTANANKGFVQTATVTTIGTDPITFSQFGGTAVQTVSGTSGRITSTGGMNPVIDIDTAYVGQNTITTLGTITTGVWNGTAISTSYGGSRVVTTGVTLFDTDLQNMYATPIQIVASLGQHNAYILNSIVLNISTNTAATGGGNVGLQYGNTNHLGGFAATTTIPSSAFAASQFRTYILLPVVGNAGIATVFNNGGNTGIYISNASGAFTLSDGTFRLEVLISYTVFTTALV